MQSQKFSIRQRLKSFDFALAGLIHFFTTQHNAIIHAIATAVVAGLCITLPLTVTEFIIIIWCVACVWMAELFNTAIEKICDHIAPHYSLKIKFVKDVAAAAVLVAAIAAFVTGLFIFIPKFL
jgi:diacylglycerol kinase (ATP)